MTMPTYDQFRTRMNDYRNQLVRRATSEKEMMLVPIGLEREYSALKEDEKLMANRVICEWLESDDAGTRWDAEYLIKKFRIASATPVLRELELHLESISATSAPARDELDKVRQLKQALSG